MQELQVILKYAHIHEIIFWNTEPCNKELMVSSKQEMSGWNAVVQTWLIFYTAFIKKDFIFQCKHVYK